MGSYIAIDDFRAGMDRRKTIRTSPAGSVWRLLNGYVNSGGEIEPRKEFVELYDLPAGTKGLSAAGDGLYVFGHDTDPGVPPGVAYQQIAHPVHAAEPIFEIVDWDIFEGDLYVVAKYDNGDIKHFFAGAVVADWHSGALGSAGATAAVLTLDSKLYANGAYTLYFPALDDPTSWLAGTGDGAIDISAKFGSSETITGLEVYTNNLAIFQRRAIQIWAVDDDPAQNRKLQTLQNVGTYASRSPTNYGDVDVFFLADSGVRSLRARDSSNNAATYDIGVPIDPYIKAYLTTLTEQQRARAIGTVEPDTGNFWLIVGTKIFVFSFYPSSKISAWSEYEVGIEISDIAILDGRLYARAGDTVYIYGGPDNNQYVEDDVEVILPFANSGKPATTKTFTSIDVDCEGTWTLYIGTNLKDPDDRELVATITGVTVDENAIPYEAEAVAISPRFVHSGGGHAKLCSFMAHHQAFKDD